MEGLSTAREINRTAERPEAISREAAHDSLNELSAIEDFYLSRIPANLAVPPLPAELVRSAEEAQPARKPVEEQSAGGNPEPGPDEVDTTVRREIDAKFAVDTLGDLPDLDSLPLFEVPPEKWPKVQSRRLGLPELKRFSGIIGEATEGRRSASKWMPRVGSRSNPCSSTSRPSRMRPGRSQR